MDPGSWTGRRVRQIKDLFLLFSFASLSLNVVIAASFIRPSSLFDSWPLSIRRPPATNPLHPILRSSKNEANAVEL